MYHPSGGTSSIQTNFIYQYFDFPVELNHLQVYFISLAIHLVSLWFIAGITLLISSFTRTSFAALAISVGVFFLPKFLMDIFQVAAIQKALQFFSINHFDIYHFLGLMGYEGNFYFADFYENVLLLIVVLFMMLLVFNICSYFSGKKWRMS